MVEIAPELLETVRRRQRFGGVAEVVLAELTGVVAQRQQHFTDAWGALTQPGRHARHHRYGKTDAERIHPGHEGGPARGTALHGVKVHEEATLVRDAVDIGGLTHHQPAMIDRGLHEADVVGHDEQDVGLVCGRDCLSRGQPARQGEQGKSPTG